MPQISWERSDIKKVVDASASQKIIIQNNNALELQLEHQIKMKQFCQASNENIKIALDIILQKIKIKNSVSRFVGFLWIEFLFTKSSFFRSLVTKILEELNEYFIFTISKPINTFNILKEKYLDTLTEWNQKYGTIYQEIPIMVKYLNQVRNISLSTVIRSNEQKERERYQQSQNIYRVKFQKIKEENYQIFEDTEEIIRELQNCFQLLEPSLKGNIFEDIINNKLNQKDQLMTEKMKEDIQIKTEIQDEDNDTNIESEANNENEKIIENEKIEEDEKIIENEEIEEDEKIIENEEIEEDEGNNNYTRYQLSLDISISKNSNVSKKNEENAILFEKIQENLKLLQKQMTILDDWYETLLRIDQENPEESELQEKLLKQTINFRNDGEYIIQKAKDIDIGIPTPKLPDFSNSAPFVDEEGDELIPVDMDSLGNNNNNNNNSQIDIEEEKRQKQLKLENKRLEREKKRLEEELEDPTISHSSYPEERSDEIDSQLLEELIPLKNQKIEIENNDSPFKIDEERKKELLHKAPVIPFFPSLGYWDQKKISLETGIEREHRFLGRSEAPILDPKKAGFFLRHAISEHKDDFNPAKSDSEKIKSRRKLYTNLDRKNNVIPTKSKSKTTKERILLKIKKDK